MEGNDKLTPFAKTDKKQETTGPEIRRSANNLTDNGHL
jgi:hypothetical protein